MAPASVFLLEKFTNGVIRFSSGRLSNTARTPAVFYGRHVPVDVLRGPLLAHAARHHIRYRVKSDADPPPRRLGYTSTSSRHLYITSSLI